MLLLGRVMPQDEPRFFSGSFSFSWSADVIGPRQTVEQKKNICFLPFERRCRVKKNSIKFSERIRQPDNEKTSPTVEFALI